jgi:hypothetical protein
MRSFRPGRVAFVIVAFVLAMGCSSGVSGTVPSSSGQGTCDDTSCGAAPDAGGPIPSFDSGASQSGDSGYPTSFGDGGAQPPSDDGGQPTSEGGQVSSEGGFPLPGDGGVVMCNPLDPKYSQEFLQASLSGLPTPCDSCVASQCCYDLLGCVAQ